MGVRGIGGPRWSASSWDLPLKTRSRQDPDKKHWAGCTSSRCTDICPTDVCPADEWLEQPPSGVGDRVGGWKWAGPKLLGSIRGVSSTGHGLIL